MPWLWDDCAAIIKTRVAGVGDRKGQEKSFAQRKQREK